MTLGRTSHAIYDTEYHLVWAPKYRKWLLRGDIQQRVKELFVEIAVNYDIVIDTMEVVADNVYFFVSFPPRYSIARVARLFKSISASVLFQEFSELKSRLWGGEFWENGYFVRTVGDEVTVEVIRKYILYHG
jgi:putative transposase